MKAMLEVYVLTINVLLFALVSAIIAIYLRKVWNANAEYAKAKNVIEEIILSFNKEISGLKNKVEEIDARLQNIQVPDLEKAFRQELNDLSAKIEKMQEHFLNLERHLNEIKIASDRGKEDFREEAKPILPVKPAFHLRREKVLAPLTPTELKVLEILSSEGDMTVREIRERIGLTREHTGRLMKSLYDKGYVERRTDKIPFLYKIKREMEGILSKSQ
jgi:DNA-binding transcriptional ArsR family regulator